MRKKDGEVFHFNNLKDREDKPEYFKKREDREGDRSFNKKDQYSGDQYRKYDKFNNDRTNNYEKKPYFKENSYRERNKLDDGKSGDYKGFAKDDKRIPNNNFRNNSPIKKKQENSEDELDLDYNYNDSSENISVAGFKDVKTPQREKEIYKPEINIDTIIDQNKEAIASHEFKTTKKDSSNKNQTQSSPANQNLPEPKDVKM